MSKGVGRNSPSTLRNIVQRATHLKSRTSEKPCFQIQRTAVRVPTETVAQRLSDWRRRRDFGVVSATQIIRSCRASRLCVTALNTFSTSPHPHLCTPPPPIHCEPKLEDCTYQFEDNTLVVVEQALDFASPPPNPTSTPPRETSHPRTSINLTTSRATTFRPRAPGAAALALREFGSRRYVRDETQYLRCPVAIKGALRAAILKCK